MGNIRQISIKNTAIDLLEKYSKEFIFRNFQHNKVKVAELTDVKSKLLGNRIAGYVTRSMSSNKKNKEKSVY